MTSTCAIYCLNFKNEVRAASMKTRFETVGINAVLHPGVPVSDPRIAGRGLIPHTEKCWSCMYGHLDMIREFAEKDSRPYAIFCEDDILIDANFKPRLEHIIADFEAMKMAIVYGSAMASFCVEQFGTTKLASITREELDGRLAQFKALMSV